MSRFAPAQGRTVAAIGALVLCAAFVLTCVAADVVAAPTNLVATTDVESVFEAYVINFVRYTRWSDSDSAGSPYVIAVLGSPDVAASLRQLAARSGQIDGHPLVVRPLALNTIAPSHDTAVRTVHDDLDDARVVYVASSHRSWNDAVIDAVAHRPVLTVGVGSAFVAQGGMLGLFEHDGRVNFSANDSAIKSAPIDVSARVLMLARPAPARSEGD